MRNEGGSGWKRHADCATTFECTTAPNMHAISSGFCFSKIHMCVFGSNGADEPEAFIRDSQIAEDAMQVVHVYMQATHIRKKSMSSCIPQLNRSLSGVLINIETVYAVFCICGLRKAHDSCANDFWITWKTVRCQQEAWVMRLCF